MRRFKSRSGATAALALAAFLLLFLIFGSYYQSQIKGHLETLSKAEVAEVTEQKAISLSLFIDKDMEKSVLLIAQLSRMNSNEYHEIEKTLSGYDPKKKVFSVVNLNSGELLSSCVPCSKTLSASKLTSFDHYPEEGIKELVVSEVTGRKVMLFFKRFVFADGAPAILLHEETVPSLANNFSFSFYRGEGFSYLVNREGNILVRPAHKVVDGMYANLFDVIRSPDNNPETIDGFMNGIRTARAGSATLTIRDQTFLMTHFPIGGTPGWSIVSLVPVSVLDGFYSEVLDTSQYLGWLIFGFILLGGGFTYLVGRNQRISADLKRVEESNELIIKTLGKYTGEIFILVDKDRETIEQITENAHRFFGIPKTEKIHRLRELLTHTVGEASFDLEQTAQSSSVVVSRMEVLNPLTHERFYLVKQSVKMEIEGSSKFVIYVSDETEEILAKQALEDQVMVANSANAHKTNFLSSMSHDIRTPLNGILGMSALLLSHAHDETRVKSSATKILSVGEHLLRLINNILDMSKIESGKTDLNLTEFDLAHTVDQMTALLRTQVHHKKQTLEVTVKSVKNEKLIGDEGRLNQILYNFLSNAVKYTPHQGKISFRIAQQPSSSPSIAEFEFVISDNGIGMSEGFRKVMFDPFTRAKSTLVNEIQGTGLGLAISKNLVDLMGGTIDVRSEEGKGTTCTVKLGFRIPKEEEDEDFWKTHKISNLLVVDDDETMCQVVLEAMNATGIALDFALSGSEALEKTEQSLLKGSPFDLILLDWEMPGMNGLETARRIKEVTASHVPILILTAYDWTEIENEARDIGIAGFIPKPFFVGQLKTTLTQIEEQRVALRNAGETDVLAGRHFLIAEDNELNAEVLTDLLELEGATCDIAENGAEAIQVFNASSIGYYDAILMDVQMPVMNGHDAALKIRELDRADKHLPILAMTANAFQDDIQQALDAEMDAHIAKPIDMAKFKETILRLLQSKGKDDGADVKDNR